MIIIYKHIQNDLLDLSFALSKYKTYGDYYIEWHIKTNFKTKSYIIFANDWLEFTVVDKQEYSLLFDGYTSIQEVADWLVVKEEQPAFIAFYAVEKMKEIQNEVTLALNHSMQKSQKRRRSRVYAL